jgi:hypothetical protein
MIDPHDQTPGTIPALPEVLVLNGVPLLGPKPEFFLNATVGAVATCRTELPCGEKFPGMVMPALILMDAPNGKHPVTHPAHGTVFGEN